MKTKIVLISIGIFILLCAVVFGLQWLGILNYQFFEPKREDARREVFENTRSYNQGMEQQLARYRLQYLRAKDQEEKDAIASTIRLQYGDYDPARLPPELGQFLRAIMNGRNP